MAEKQEVIELNQPQKAFDYENGKVILSVRHLKQYFRFGRGQFKYTKAVHDVSFDVYKGEVFGLVGESGCGKTTTGRSIIKLYKITSGDVWFKGVRIAAGTRWNEKEIKFTNIRLREALKELKNKEKEELNLLKLSYQDKEDGNKEDYEKQVKAIKEKYAALRKEQIEPANEIVSTQREKIKLAKHDDRHCNDDIAKAAVAKVKEKYADLFSPENLVKKAKLNPETEENKAILQRYSEYQKKLKEAKNASITRSIQMIFQDPIASLNPRMTIRNIIAEGLIIRGVKDKAFIDKEVKRVLELVGFLPEHANRYPHEFSGGQRQRIGIARALIMNPSFLICDEPISALDVSIRAQIINLLNDLKEEMGLTIMFIAHDLSVVKYFCDRIAVMYYGEIVELASSDELFKNPLHPYTNALLSAIPKPDPISEKVRKRYIYNPLVEHDYSKEAPKLVEITPGHFVLANSEELEAYKKKLK